MSDVDRFVTELEHELREKKLTLLDSEILAALESKRATRAQIGEWAKVFCAATRHGHLAEAGDLKRQESTRWRSVSR